MELLQSAGSGSTRLHRDVGFWGMTAFSLGSIIGSGWLLGALTAASVAGAASLISWILAAFMLALLALVHAELGGAYFVAGGTARFPHFAFGSLTGFTGGWMSWLQAVPVAPIETEASLSYLAHISWVHSHVHILHTNGTLTGSGLILGTVFMVVFTIINLVGVRFLSNTNSIAVAWKTAIPLLTVVVLLTTTFHSSNFKAGGGFAPFGAHGIFAALPAGVVFALEGFEGAIQMAGEARKPRDIPRAVLTATGIGTVIYLLLEVAFIGALAPHNLLHGWASPVGAGDFGPFATLATVAGAGWLAATLYIDAVVSPAGAGLTYISESARLTYAMGKQRDLPTRLARTSLRGIPVTSVILAFVIGELCFLPFPSWQSLVGLITSANAIMYGFAPPSLHALRRRDPDRNRPYKIPWLRVTCPAAFVSANLIVYWSGWSADWKIAVALAVGYVLFTITRARIPAAERRPLSWRGSSWIWPWLGGLLIIDKLGQYGGTDLIPFWWDIVVVILFSIVVYIIAIHVALPSEKVASLIQEDEDEMALQSVPAQSSGPAMGGAPTTM